MKKASLLDMSSTAGDGYHQITHQGGNAHGTFLDMTGIHDDIGDYLPAEWRDDDGIHNSFLYEFPMDIEDEDDIELTIKGNYIEIGTYDGSDKQYELGEGIVKEPTGDYVKQYHYAPPNYVAEHSMGKRMDELPYDDDHKGDVVQMTGEYELEIHENHFTLQTEVEIR